ncbi:MAG TPA: S8 family serine peptidase [Legionella sp.]|nr:S8 family serine peptidase [Legionella sp.]
MNSIIMKRHIISIFFLMALWTTLQAHQFTIDKNVQETFSGKKNNQNVTSLILFFKTNQSIPTFLQSINSNSQISVEPLNFMPAVVLTCPKDPLILERISQFPGIFSIALNKPAAEKIEISPSTKKPRIQFRYPGIDKWWAHNFKGQSGVIGIIDSGIDATHQAFLTKNIIINKSKTSGYYSYPEGIRSPHGTGVACIYAGYPLDEDEHIRGVSYKAPVILSALAGEGEKNIENFWITYSSLNWMFSLSPLKPTIINYSFGNGDVTCPSCPDWSGMSKVVDYIVNTHKILWVTSAGNNGYISQRKTAPFVSTLTVAADNYNALTVANMNMYVVDNENDTRKYNREKHVIRYSSSRGPTLLGRKKPDITAPGNDTYTCAPEKAYRLMGGTSAAAPHVGGAVVLVEEAGITNPMAIKALLINSADSWTDSNKPGPDDPAYPYSGGHHPVNGSEWNPTYGWGYLNMEHAYNQRKHIISSKLTLKHPFIDYKMKLNALDKITLVHERRVGFTNEGQPWKLSHLSLEVFDSKTQELLASDASSIDTIHQVSLCSMQKPKSCIPTDKREVIVRVSLLDNLLEGASQEEFSLAYS